MTGSLAAGSWIGTYSVFSCFVDAIYFLVSLSTRVLKFSFLNSLKKHGFREMEEKKSPELFGVSENVGLYCVSECW